MHEAVDRSGVPNRSSVGSDAVERSESSGSGPDGRPVRLQGRDALGLHLTLVVGLALCAVAFTVELWRALDGHTFSWLYVFEWPIFAAFALYMWWNLLQGNDRVRRPSPPGQDAESGPSGPAQERDEKLEAWTRYVRELEAGQKAEPGSG